LAPCHPKPCRPNSSRRWCSQQTCRAKRGGMLWMVGPSRLRWRMSCDGLVTAGRTPTVVRPTDDVMSLQLCGHRAHAIDKYLRDATRPTGSGLSYLFPSSRVPSGHDASVAKRLRCCLVVSAAKAGITKATSPTLLVPDAAHTTGLWPFGAPFLSKSLQKNDSWPVRAGASASSSTRTCYLVDPASSHMLVSKIKPCMCKYELIRTVKLRMAH
jgi:hypothetical protein